MTYISPEPPLGEADAALLKALRERFGGDRFDEQNVAVGAPHDGRLMAALGFLNPTIDRRRNALSYRTREALAGWLERVENRPAGGLVLRKDGIGWSRVVDATEPPVLPAHRTPGGGQLAVFCDDCGRFHYHGSISAEFGSGDGHRLAHCAGDGPLRQTGYILREVAGPMPQYSIRRRG